MADVDQQIEKFSFDLREYSRGLFKEFIGAFAFAAIVVALAAGGAMFAGLRDQAGGICIAVAALMCGVLIMGAIARHAHMIALAALLHAKHQGETAD